jgi:hypothetical protein
MMSGSIRKGFGRSFQRVSKASEIVSEPSETSSAGNSFASIKKYIYKPFIAKTKDTISRLMPCMRRSIAKA